MFGKQAEGKRLTVMYWVDAAGLVFLSPPLPSSPFLATRIPHTWWDQSLLITSAAVTL